HGRSLLPPASCLLYERTTVPRSLPYCSPLLTANGLPPTACHPAPRLPDGATRSHAGRGRWGGWPGGGPSGGGVGPGGVWECWCSALPSRGPGQGFSGLRGRDGVGWVLGAVVVFQF